MNHNHPRSILLAVFIIICAAGTLFFALSSQRPRTTLLYPLTDSIVTTSKSPPEMTIRAKKFTPEVLLSAPRRSSAIPNSEGKLALYTVSTYSFESQTKTNEIRVLDLEHGPVSALLTTDEKTSEPNWLEDDVLYLKGVDNGVTHIIVSDLNMKTYVAGIVLAPVSNVKLKLLEEGKVAIAVTAQTTPDGTLYNPEIVTKKRSTGLVYDSLMVRNWDRYVSPNRNSIWYGLLERSKPHITESKGRWIMSSLTNALEGTHLESPIPTFGSTDHFDVSSTGIAFVAKDPSLNPATNTKANFYYVPVKSFKSAPKSLPQIVEVEGLEGACTSPIFSPDGRAAAFLQMKQNGYESDKNRVIVIPDISKLSSATEALNVDNGKGLWDRSPHALLWSNSGRILYIQAEEQGRGLLFKLEIPATVLQMTKLPEKVTSSGYISNIYPLADDSDCLLISSSTLVDNSLYTIFDPENPPDVRVVSSNSRQGTSFGLSTDQVSEIYFPGATGAYDVHAWVVKPSSFDHNKKYPLAYVIHGGPQGAWGDQWSTRWNPAVFAEQGYIVVAPNPTGSTGYGQGFCDAIQNSWGGLPYQDIVEGFEFIKSELPYVDTDRAVALGASYGGYMMNWIQGHPLGREFKALVCHDGVFSMTNQQSSDEQYFPNHEFGGPYWEARENWDRWDPARYTENWSTPQLVIHNELDYRLPISEGLAAFNVLQEKGIESRFLTFPDENHWVMKEENSLVWHTVVLNWINHYAGLPPFKEVGQEGFEVQSTPLFKKQRVMSIR